MIKNKQINIFFLTMISVLLLSACGGGSKGEIEQVSLDEMEEILETGNGYILIYRETSDDYLKDIEEVNEEQKKNIKMYDIYKEDGKNRNDDDGWITPSTQRVDRDTLYLIEDGELVQELTLTDYEGIDRTEEIENMLK